MVPLHILNSDLYKQLNENYGDDMSFIKDMTIINYEKIENDIQFKEYIDNCNYWCVNELPHVILDYACNNDINNAINNMNKIYGDMNTILKKIKIY